MTLISEKHITKKNLNPKLKNNCHHNKLEKLLSKNIKDN